MMMTPGLLASVTDIMTKDRNSVHVIMEVVGMDNPIQEEEKESKDSLYITQGRTERSPGGD